MAKDLHHGVSDQSKASLRRREDAEALFQSGRWQGAMYLGGYAVECLLKAALMHQFDCRTLADLERELRDRGLMAADSTMYTHQFETLFRVAGHFDRLRASREVWPRFRTVNLWRPSLRYDPHPVGPEDAQDFLEAVDQIVAWIRSNI